MNRRVLLVTVLAATAVLLIAWACNALSGFVGTWVAPAAPEDHLADKRTLDPMLRTCTLNTERDGRVVLEERGTWSRTGATVTVLLVEGNARPERNEIVLERVSGELVSRR